ncbi:hypothetical protein ABTM91_20135, partial [Acinetobacter baumannii]
AMQLLDNRWVVWGVIITAVFGISLLVQTIKDAKDENPSKQAQEKFARLSPEEKARWAIGIPGMSQVMRMRQIDAIEGATRAQKEEWKRQVR